MKTIIEAYGLALDALLPGHKDRMNSAGRNPEKQYRYGEKRW